MKLEMTNCYFCERAMPMGAAICPHCGKMQKGGGKANPFQPRMLLALALAAAVLIAWNWFKAP